MSYMEKADGRVKFARRRAALEVWLKMSGATMDLHSVGEGAHFLSLAGAQYFLTGRNCPNRIGHNDFEGREGQNKRFFMLVLRSEAIIL